VHVFPRNSLGQTVRRCLDGDRSALGDRYMSLMYRITA
jgi:hypothetical protein